MNNNHLFLASITSETRLDFTPDTIEKYSDKYHSLNAKLQNIISKLVIE